MCEAFGCTALCLCPRRLYRKALSVCECCKKHTLHLMCKKIAQKTMCGGHTHTRTRIRPPLFAAFAPVLFASYWNSNQVRDKSAQTNTGASCQNRQNISIGGGETCGNHLFCSVNTFHPTACHRNGNRIVPIVSQ